MMTINDGGANAYLDDVKKVPHTRRGLGPPVKELGDRLKSTTAFVHRSGGFRERRGGFRPVSPSMLALTGPFQHLTINNSGATHLRGHDLL
jgi:hypothetical protein